MSLPGRRRYCSISSTRRAAAKWRRGAAGERSTARLLRRLERRGFVVLHDRGLGGHDDTANAGRVAAAGIGNERSYVDKKTSTTVDRDGLNAPLAYVRPGDTIVVHTSTDSAATCAR